MKYFEQEWISRCKDIHFIFTGWNKHSSILQAEIKQEWENGTERDMKQSIFFFNATTYLSPIFKRNAVFVFSMATGSKGQLPEPSSYFESRKEICEKACPKMKPDYQYTSLNASFWANEQHIWNYLRDYSTVA